MPPIDVTPNQEVYKKIFLDQSTNKPCAWTRKLGYRVVYFVSKSEFERLLAKINEDLSIRDTMVISDFSPSGEYDLYYWFEEDTPVAVLRSGDQLLTIGNSSELWLVYPWDESNVVFGTISYGWPEW
ncbi:MAG: hypothetical protein GYA36_23270 [Veillonellaceae bacterium]|nr:hypothetical protein [Veillonellaceae bacterium]